MTPHKLLIACVVRQYGTGLYRTCVSLEKNSVICLSTHQDEASATEMINRFLETHQNGQIKSPEDVLIFIDSTRAPMPVPMPMEDQAGPPIVIEQHVEELAA